MLFVARKPILCAMQSMVRNVRYGSGHDGDHPPFGPTVNMDYVPVPLKSYNVTYNELQKKFNRYMVIGSVCMLASVSLAMYLDIFKIELFRSPKSYREQSKCVEVKE